MEETDHQEDYGDYREYVWEEDLDNDDDEKMSEQSIIFNLSIC